MEIIMATEALDLPRNAAVTIRIPRRLRVLLRAIRIARISRSLKLYRALADRDEGILADVGVSHRKEGRRDGWVEDLAKTQMSAFLLIR
jgi:hypothetical protein